MLKTANLQAFYLQLWPMKKNVTIISLYLFIPILTPRVEIQLTFNEATRNIYKVSYDEYYRERRVLSDLILQHNIESDQQVNSPK